MFDRVVDALLDSEVLQFVERFDVAQPRQQAAVVRDLNGQAGPRVQLEQQRSAG